MREAQFIQGADRLFMTQDVFTSKTLMPSGWPVWPTGNLKDTAKWECITHHVDLPARLPWRLWVGLDGLGWALLRASMSTLPFSKQAVTPWIASIHSCASRSSSACNTCISDLNCLSCGASSIWSSEAKSTLFWPGLLQKAVLVPTQMPFHELFACRVGSACPGRLLVSVLLVPMLAFAWCTRRRTRVWLIPVVPSLHKECGY